MAKKKDSVSELEKKVEALSSDIESYRDLINNLIRTMAGKSNMKFMDKNIKSKRDTYREALQKRLPLIPNIFSDEIKKVESVLEKKDATVTDLIDVYNAVSLLGATAKPNITQIWAETGNTTPATLSEQSDGWNPTLPISTYFNDRFNKYDSYCKYFEEQGVSQYDATVDYPIDGWTRGSDNSVYQSLVTPNVGNDPVIDTGINWLKVINTAAIQSVPPRENILIATNFDNNLWNRNVLFSNLTGNRSGYAAYTADRWQFLTNDIGAANVTISRNAVNTVVDGVYITNAYRILVNVGETVFGALPSATLTYHIEARDFKQLFTSSLTTNLFIFTAVPGIYSLSLQNATKSRSWITEMNIPLANTWTNLTAIIASAQSAGGTWFAAADDKALTINIALIPDAKSTTSLDQWVSGDLRASTNQVNFFNAATNVFQFAHVKMEGGAVFTGWQEPLVEQTWALQERYYQKSYSRNVTPGTPGATGGQLSVNVDFANPTTATSDLFQVGYPTSMRTDPVSGGGDVFIYSPTTGAINFARVGAVDLPAVKVSSDYRHFNIQINAVIPSGDQRILAHYTADAELI